MNNNYKNSSLQKLEELQSKYSQNNGLLGDSPSVLVQLNSVSVEQIYRSGGSFDKENPFKIKGLEHLGILTVYDIDEIEEVAILLKKDGKGNVFIKTGEYNQDLRKPLFNDLCTHLENTEPLDINEKMQDENTSIPSVTLLDVGKEYKDFDKYLSLSTACGSFLDNDNLTPSPLKLAKAFDSFTFLGVNIQFPEGSGYRDVKDGDIGYCIENGEITKSFGIDTETHTVDLKDVPFGTKFDIVSGEDEYKEDISSQLDTPSVSNVERQKSDNNEHPTKSSFEIYDYVLPSHWASYLINNDASGISVDDKKEADAFMEKVVTDNNLFSVTPTARMYQKDYEKYVLVNSDKQVKEFELDEDGLTEAKELYGDRTANHTAIFKCTEYEMSPIVSDVDINSPEYDPLFMLADGMREDSSFFMSYSDASNMGGDMLNYSFLVKEFPSDDVLIDSYVKIKDAERKISLYENDEAEHKIVSENKNTIDGVVSSIGIPASEIIKRVERNDKEMWYNSLDAFPFSKESMSILDIKDESKEDIRTKIREVNDKVGRRVKEGGNGEAKGISPK